MSQFSATALTAALAFVTLQAHVQTTSTGADPYANNANAGKTQFTLAAPAGKDSGAINTAPAGAVNQGPFDPAKWKYGPAYDISSDTPKWNPRSASGLYSVRIGVGRRRQLVGLWPI